MTSKELRTALNTALTGLLGSLKDAEGNTTNAVRNGPVPADYHPRGLIVTIALDPDVEQRELQNEEHMNIKHWQVRLIMFPTAPNTPATSGVFPAVQRVQRRLNGRLISMNAAEPHLNIVASAMMHVRA